MTDLMDDINNYIKEVDARCEKNIPCFKLSVPSKLRTKIWAIKTAKILCKECYESGKYLELRSTVDKLIVDELW